LPDPTPLCPKPTIKAADKAHAAITTSRPGGKHTDPPVWKPNPKNPLPILPMTDKGAKGRYFNGGFYQFGNSLFQKDGLGAVNDFCHDLAKNSSWLGPDGMKPLDKSLPQIKANVS
jgi:hypothetical protein